MNATKGTIISNLFMSKNFCDCIRKTSPQGLDEDLRQEVISRICELSEAKVIDLHQKKELEFYTVRVILNEVKNKYSGFSRKFKGRHQELSGNEVVEDILDEERGFREMLEDLATGEIDKLYWYDAEMIRLYMKLGTFRAIEMDTGIPYISCYKNIKKSLALLKERAIVQAAKPLFTKAELKKIADTPKLTIKLT